MDFLASIERIKTALKESGKSDLANEILELQLSGGTGGEVLISICSKLLNIRKTDKSSYDLLKDESESLIRYSKSIGLYPKSRV